MPAPTVRAVSARYAVGNTGLAARLTGSARDSYVDVSDCELVSKCTARIYADTESLVWLVPLKERHRGAFIRYQVYRIRYAKMTCGRTVKRLYDYAATDSAVISSDTVKVVSGYVAVGRGLVSSDTGKPAGFCSADARDSDDRYRCRGSSNDSREP